MNFEDAVKSLVVTGQRVYQKRKKGQVKPLEKVMVIEFLVMGLTVWRISSIIVREEFVFSLAQKMRTALGVTGYEYLEELHDETFTKRYEDYESHLQLTWIARGITCLWCISFWVGLLFGLAYMYVYGVDVYSLCLPFSLSGFAIVFDKVVYS